MRSPLRRLQSAVRGLLGGDRGETALSRPAQPPPDLDLGEKGPGGWLDAIGAAHERGLPLSEAAREGLRRLAEAHSAQDLVPSDEARSRLLSLLRPTAGLSARLRELDQTGLLGVLLGRPPLASGSGAASRQAVDEPTLLAVEHVERLASSPSLAGERFGSLLREVRAPQILVLALLLRGRKPQARGGEEEAAAADRAAGGLGLRADTREMLAFLLRQQLQMPLVAFKQDSGDPAVVHSFAALFNLPSSGDRDPPEEHLKMLCLLTVADLGGKGPGGLTPWKAEVLWRLFVDAYNTITMSYGDEVIAEDQAALASLQANRPHDILESEMHEFLDGLPQRYLGLFDADSIFQHIRLARQIGPQDIHSFLKRRSEVWELTVVTLDKPYLFSNVCGVLSSCGLDILRGQALTSRSGLVLDVFQFTDHKGCLVRPQLEPLLSAVVAGRRELPGPAVESPAARPAGGAAAPPVIYFDNESSNRYTILELSADDAPGLLHRVSRVISRHGCSIDLTLISTEGGRAFDVFHMRKNGAKLGDAEALALTEDFERELAPPTAR